MRWPIAAVTDCSTDELFDIIIEFPESMAALEDLKVMRLLWVPLTAQDCMFKIDQRDQVVEKLRAA